MNEALLRLISGQLHEYIITVNRYHKALWDQNLSEAANDLDAAINALGAARSKIDWKIKDNTMCTCSGFPTHAPDCPTTLKEEQCESQS